MIILSCWHSITRRHPPSATVLSLGFLDMADSDDEVPRTSGKTRSGRIRANPRAPRSHQRAKEAAELIRVKAAVAAIPVCEQTPLFRVNRRQRAQLKASPDAKPNVPNAAILRCSKFAELPLSELTRDALAAANFDALTPVQRAAIPQALASRDVLVAAPTGSGKTLAFIVPLVEALWRNRWSVDDRLGAIVLAPTRELAIQIFQVLRKVAHFHALSAGLVIGGKEFEGERTRVGHMNILIATPGRLLHHLDTVADIDCASLRVLVLDEADRILDMGFEKTLDAILEHLPTDRQTMLFSATQTKSVKALARLSLKSPQYISVMSRMNEQNAESENVPESNEKGDFSGENKLSTDSQIVGTPSRLSQSFATVSSHDKLVVLWSFLKTHLRSKIIVFFATGKQVRFAFNTFCKLRPGMSLLHMHGSMKQLRRTEMFDAFTKTKNAALFATDIASRGLDFPNVDWVVQVDCPDDVETYVHRVGRTARFRSNGRAMLFLGDGKEQEFLERLKEKGLELNKVRINPDRVASITPRISSAVASSKELKYLAQRAFLFYLKSVFQQADKEVFDVTEHNYELLSKSFGLAVLPTVTFKGERKDSNRAAKAKSKTVFGYRPRVQHEGKANAGKRKAVADEVERDGSGGLIVQEDDDSDADILTVKRVIRPDDSSIPENDAELKGPTERKRKRMKLDHVNRMASVNRIVFDEEGNAKRASEIVRDGSADEGDDICDHDNVDSYAGEVAKRLEATSEMDRTRERDRVRTKHIKQKEKLRKLNKMRKPDADVQTRLIEASGMQEDSDDDDSANVESDADADADAELALKIIEARRQ